MNYHLLKTEGEWRLREEGSSNDEFAAETKAAALEQLGDFMESREGYVVVHRADGSIQEHRDYTREPQARSRNAKDSGGLSKRTWGLIGVITAAAVTAASLAYIFRDSIPTERLRIR